MATALWPTIHRLSNLSSLKKELEEMVRSGQMSSKVAVLRTEFETTSEAIEAVLQQWQPCLPPGFSPEEADHCLDKVDGKVHPLAINTSVKDPETAEHSRLHSIFNNVMAYRHSALVYLYRTIYGYPCPHPIVQSHTHKALVHCVATCSYQGPMVALLWPLFVAACEAVSIQDQDLARAAFLRVEQRQGMMNIKRAWDIEQEVWRRADVWEDHDGVSRNHVGHRADLWREVSQDMGVDIVLA
jgi:hypothetical protein